MGFLKEIGNAFESAFDPFKGLADSAVSGFQDITGQTGEDAAREGGYTLDEFKEVWEDLHGEWNPNESVYVIKFKLAKLI